MTDAATLLDGRYALDEKIGAGAFCEVWRATDTVLARPVAVKLLHASFAHRPQEQARFEAEAQHAAALSHENVARVYDYGAPARGQAYLVMELIEGPSLAAVLAEGPLDAMRAMDIVAQVAAGLQAAHSAGLIHRDIKPANILFTPEGAARLTDFGIACVAGSAPRTDAGMVMGTPGYLAPERIAGFSASSATDLYALGIVAYECMAGKRPFSGSALEVSMAHLERPLPPLPASLPAEVTAFVMTLTAKDPASRPTSADDVLSQARRLRDQLFLETIGSRPVPGGSHPTTTDGARGQGRGHARSRERASRPRRAAVAALSAVACLALLAVTWLTLASHPGGHPSSAPPQSPPAARSPSASPGATRPAGRQPSHGTNTVIGTAATIGPTAAQHIPPGQLRKESATGSASCPGLALGREKSNAAASKAQNRKC